MYEPDMTFNRKAVRPMQCLRDGWRLIKDDYWLFFGITFVGVLIASMGPMGLLIGPLMCGIHLCLLHQESGNRVSFNLLFQGFEYFVPSLVATMVMLVPLVVILLGFYIVFIVALFSMIAANPPQQGGGPPAEMLALILGLEAAVIVLVIGVSLILQILFMFIYPLIVDRRVSGLQAVGLSFRAAFANFFGLLGLVLLIMLLNFAGALACYVGMFFVLPVQYAMIAVAYRQVFPDRDRFAEFPPDEPDPEEPAPIALPGDTGIRTEEVVRVSSAVSTEEAKP